MEAILLKEAKAPPKSENREPTRRRLATRWKLAKWSRKA